MNQAPLPNIGGTLPEWRAVSEQVMRGEFRNADASTKEAITTGLRGFAVDKSETRIRQAMVKLEEQGDPEPVAKVRVTAAKPKAARKAETGGLF